MSDNFVAIAIKGKEFFYKRSSMIAVPDGKAHEVAEILNHNKYLLKDGEVWHVYENDSYSNDYISKEIKAVRNGKVTVHRNYY